MKTRHIFAAICGLGLLAGGLTACATRTQSAHSDRVQLPVRLPLYFTPNPAAPGSFSVHGAGASAVFAASAVRFDLANGTGEATRSASVALDFIGASPACDAGRIRANGRDRELLHGSTGTLAHQPADL